jgi:O-antigen/teichoic acid export membrane protein
MGGHRIDIVRKISTILTILEATAVIVTLSLGQGLLSLAAIMGISEFVYVITCWLAARRVVPEISVQASHFDAAVIFELVRFAGSYQVVNLLEVVYASLIPLSVLKAFGASVAGLYALVSRVVGVGLMLHESYLPSILSSGAMVYASGSVEDTRQFFAKAFKAAWGLSILPLAFIAAFGPTMVYIWTHQTDTGFRATFLIVSATAFFKSMSLLGLVLYRTLGRAMLDNVRQVLRIVLLLAIVVFAKRLGYYGVLGGMAVVELAGMVFMWAAVTYSTGVNSVRDTFGDVTRTTAATAIIIAVGVSASHLPFPAGADTRIGELVGFLKIGIGCGLALWPAAVCTKCLTPAEWASIRNIFAPTSCLRDA